MGFLSNKTIPVVTGISVPKSEFVLPEVHRKPSSHLLDVLNGKAVGLIVHSYLTSEQCECITKNFHNNTGLHARQDNVKGITVGADLYGSDPDSYIRATSAARNAVEDLFREAVNVPALLRSDIQRLLPAGVAIRPAACRGVEFNYSRAIGWTDTGQYALKLHDDKAQLGDPRQHELETSLIKNSVAFNVYPSVTEAGGELELININPDLETKQRLDIQHTGYPYPAELLAQFDRLIIKPQPGDLVIIAGSFVHGVRGVHGEGFRLLLNHFAGFMDEQTVITWS